jgi:hypothetical protein
MSRPVEKEVRELCLVCRGERWLPDLADPSRSRPCPHCQGEGWVLISPASLGEAEESLPESPPKPKKPQSKA